MLQSCHIPDAGSRNIIFVQAATEGKENASPINLKGSAMPSKCGKHSKKEKMGKKKRSRDGADTHKSSRIKQK
jgi:hypothetical protein